MTFALGSISALNVASWEGFDYPNRTTLVSIIAADDTPGNAIPQSSGLTYPTARISGTITSGTDLAALRGYYEGVTQATFTDDDANTATVIVLDLSISRLFIDVWRYSCTLVALVGPTPPEE